MNQPCGPTVGERIRVALLHSGAWRPLMWLRVGSDGSLYVGLLLGRPTHGGKGTKSGGSTIDVRYDEATPVSADDLRKGSRVSFKASGEIHLGADVFSGTQLNQLAQPTQLCLTAFVHPSRYRPPAKRAASDYDFALVDYPVDDTCPMYASVSVAPWNGGPVQPQPPLRSMKVWGSFAFGFSGLKRTPDYALGVTIGHGIAGPWPPLPFLVVPRIK